MKSPETLITTVFYEWMEYSQRFSSETQNLHRTLISRFIESLPEGVVTVNQIRKEHAESFLESIVSQYAPSSFIKRRKFLNAFYKWFSWEYNVIVERRITKTKPIPKSEPKQPEPKQPEPTPAKIVPLKPRLLLPAPKPKLLLPAPKPKPKPKHRPKPKLKPKPIPTIKETDGASTVFEWLEYCQRYTTDTQKHYRSEITRFFEYAGIENVNELSCRLIEQFISKLISEGLANSTVNKILSVIKSFCNWLARNYETPNFAKGIKELREDPPQQRFLSWNEYQKVLSVAEGQHAYIAKFLANTGVRTSELRNLKWGDVSEDFKLLTVSKGKGRKRRYVPLNDVCQEILQKYGRGSDDSFLDFVEHCRSRKTVYNICANLAKKAGIPRAGAHAFRHLFATEMLRRGADIYYVSKILGHSNVLITQKTYEHFLPNYLNGATDILVGGKNNG